MLGGAGREVVPPKNLSPLFDRLFFQTTGVIDIIGAEIGYPAYCDVKFGGIGGYFTSSFWRTLENRKADRQRTWDQIFDEVRTATNNTARQNSARQYPVLSRYTWATDRSDGFDHDIPDPGINTRNVESKGLSSRSPSLERDDNTPDALKGLQQKQQLLVFPQRSLRWRLPRVF